MAVEIDARSSIGREKKSVTPDGGGFLNAGTPATCAKRQPYGFRLQCVWRLPSGDGALSRKEAPAIAIVIVQRVADTPTPMHSFFSRRDTERSNRSIHANNDKERLASRRMFYFARNAHTRRNSPSCATAPGTGGGDHLSTLSGFPDDCTGAVRASAFTLTSQPNTRPTTRPANQSPAMAMIAARSCCAERFPREDRLSSPKACALLSFNDS